MRAESSPDIGDVPPAESASVAYEMLDVPVVVDVEAREARARLKAAYASVLLDEIPGTPPVRAALRSADSGSWTAAHEDWTTEPAPLVETVRALNHRLLHAVMRRRTDLFYVHAGVVVIGPVAVALTGVSEAGKSTLVLALLDRGARYLSDELLAWSPRTRTAHPVPRSPKIRDVCVPWFPDHAEAFVGEGEGRFLPLSRDRLARPAPLAAVIVPRWTAAPEELLLSDAGPGETLLALTSSALNFGAHRERSIDILTEMMRGPRGYRLAWHDPHAAAARIEALVTEPA